MSARLIIVRHAMSMGNRQNSFQGQIDTDLAPQGEEQLIALSARFSAMEFDAIYSSPLKRAYRTAEACRGDRDMPIVTDKRLMEINGGVMEGVSWDEVHIRFPQQARYWQERSPLFSPEGGESMAQVRRRIIEAVTEIAAAHEGKTVVVVTHGCTLRNLICWAKGLPLEQLKQADRWSNTGIGIIEMADGVPTLIMENDHSHLDIPT